MRSEKEIAKALKLFKKYERKFWKSRGPYRDGSVPLKKLKDTLHTGDWSGRRCWIIGGGPSLKGFDFNTLRGELTIGVNKAFLHHDPTIIFSGDYRFYKKLMMFNTPKRERLWTDDEERCYQARAKYLQSHAYKVWLDTEGGAFGDEVFVVDYAGHYNKETKKFEGEEAISFNLEDGIYQGRNSGYAALNLAIALGASPIILLGFDMLGRDGKAAWFHEGYEALSEWQRTESVYDRFLEQFRSNFCVAHRSRQTDTPQQTILATSGSCLVRSGCDEVIQKSIHNFSMNTALDCFPFPTITEIRKIKRPLYVSYYTNAHYYKASLDLARSLHRHGLDYVIERVADLGNWQANTSFKPKFILAMMERYPDRDIVWLDADSVVQRFPDLFQNFSSGEAGTVDLAFYTRPGRGLLSGTLYFTNNGVTHHIVDEWIKECEIFNKQWEQTSLQNTLDRICNFPIYAGNLPETYCKIFDSKDQCSMDEAVITHWQESRNQKRRES